MFIHKKNMLNGVMREDVTILLLLGSRIIMKLFIIIIWMQISMNNFFCIGHTNIYGFFFCLYKLHGRNIYDL